MAHQLISKPQIRKHMRRKRDLLSRAQLRLAEAAVVRSVGLLPGLRRAQRILSYIPLGGEISPLGIERMLANNEIFKPRITSFDKGLMQFYPAQGKKSCNKFGIWEPAAIGSPMPAQYFDAVLVPLVAFDRSGNRLGMGAGFYDRAFSFRLRNAHSKRPILIGLAHHFQEVESLDAQSWDVPLDAILTDRELIKIQ